MFTIPRYFQCTIRYSLILSITPYESLYMKIEFLLITFLSDTEEERRERTGVGG